MPVLLVLVFLLIIFLEAPGLIKKKWWREMIAVSFFLLLGFALSLPQVLGFELPSPNIVIEAIFKPISDWLRVTT
ncbi:hypothetical protein DCCM_4327 [Desulfocucumis palustris]|uniref:Uncharacterized protein n=1 Tax=Desulfocucumis palustris TaxID=1898651 RepID=A0A2L2XGT3_9FIRM|nr:hypothetical protein [Desulfocucumis palustris]GBF35204.1 hypothetical protein DCCM_4327 [Desulfocucumis palustris]